ncbi:MAG TPA: exonuclease SbcCD subunit D, partial [Allocoleopsis sp.]
IQIITLPWLTRSTLLTRPETEGLALAEVNQLLIDRLRVALEGEIRRLDPNLPTVLLAHLMTDTARFGAERFLAVGKGFHVPMTLLARPCFDYVALGHVHRHQILAEHPPVVYPGSIERVDFSEEEEEKGFVLVEVDRGAATVEFCPLAVRPFHTIKLNLSESEDPQAALVDAIDSASIQDAVVRVIYQIRSEQLDQIDNAALHQALSDAHTYTIHAELISQLARPRLPELGTGMAIDPMEALKTYIINQPHLADIAAELMEAAQAILTQQQDSDAFSQPEWQAWQESLEFPELAEANTAPEAEVSQLRLL